MNKVPIYYKDLLAGELEHKADGRFIFTYNQVYLRSDKPELSLTLPKREEPFEAATLFPFFDGLIPEGWLLNLASNELRLNPLRDRFELLSNLCHDAIGAVHVGEKAPHSEKNLKKKSKNVPFLNSGKCLICYEKSDSIYHHKCMLNIFGEEITPIVDIDEEILEALARTQLNQKLALAGAQKKLSFDLTREKGKIARMTVTDLWGKFIFKPKGNAPHFPENEHLCIKLAESFKIQVEKSALIPTASGELGFMARRFDRGPLQEEYHQEDFCQILNRPAYSKYSGSIEQIGKVLKGSSDFPGDNIYRLYELSLFNFIIGNVDAHLKNFSLIFENEDGVRRLLSPAYDLLSTDLYLEDNEETALAINGKKNKLTKDDFLKLAQHLGIHEKVHYKLVARLQKHLPKWDQLIDKSFLQAEKKVEFKELIRNKLARL